MNTKLFNKLDYLFIIAIWVVIFTSNIFSSMAFVDYSPHTEYSISSFVKELSMSNFNYSNYLFAFFKLILSLFGIVSLSFQLFILLCMFVSYFYIRKLTPNKTYRFLFSLIFFFNPFVYSRIMIGQLGILVSYLFLPILLYYLFLLFEYKENSKHEFKIKPLLGSVLSLTLISSFSPHFFALSILIVEFSL